MEGEKKKEKKRAIDEFRNNFYLVYTFFEEDESLFTIHRMNRYLF